jgi:glutamate dehydrogenase/leucine dehydrogenase
MSYKLAMAGLPYGGAKAALIIPTGEYDREALLGAYAEEISKLQGAFITGTDVGITNDDVYRMRKISPFFVGISVDPAVWTAKGIFSAIRATCVHLYGNDDLSQRVVAVQGAGKIGGSIARLLAKRGAKVYIADIDSDAIEKIQADVPNIIVVSSDTIHTIKADIFAPCALAGVINADTINDLQVKAVVGGANNQLKEPSMADALHERGIIYVPDYISNAGGLISVVSEYEDTANASFLEGKIAEIYERVLMLLSSSHSQSVSPVTIANYEAEQRFNSAR